LTIKSAQHTESSHQLSVISSQSEPMPQLQLITTSRPTINCS